MREEEYENAQGAVETSGEIGTGHDLIKMNCRKCSVQCVNLNWHRLDSWLSVLIDGEPGDKSGEKAGPRLSVLAKNVGLFPKDMARCYRWSDLTTFGYWENLL